MKWATVPDKLFLISGFKLTEPVWDSSVLFLSVAAIFRIQAILWQKRGLNESP